MGKSKSIRTSVERFAIVLSGVLSFAAMGCGAEPMERVEQDDSIGSAQEAIDGNWTTLTLINGWQNYWGSAGTPPAVGKVNGIVVFRGALKATNPTSNVPFNMPANFEPDGTAIFTRIVLSGGVGATLAYDYLNHNVKIIQDDVSPAGVGQAAKTMTSLDGASFDVYAGTAVNASPAWNSLYGFRQLVNGDQGYVYVKQVNGFVRMQGFLYKPNQEDYDNYLFTLPSEYRTNNTVQVAANFGTEGTASSAWGQLTIYPNGDVYVQGNPIASNKGTSLEGVSYSRTLSGNIALPLSNGWAAASARQVRVGKYGGVVRFQGGISGGTTTTIGTLPSGYRPPKTIFLPSVAYGPTSARIVINTSGVMTVENPGGLSVSTLFLSLDGVSFGI